MNERLLRKGHLEDLKSKYQNLKVKVSGLVLQLRIQLDPYDDPINLPGESIRVGANELADVLKEIKAIKEKIDQIEADLE